MSEELDKYRNVMLDRASTESARRSERITVHIDGEELEVEIRAQSMADFSQVEPPDDLVEELGAEMANNLAFIGACAYVPGTDDKIFTSDDDLRALADVPFQQGSWVQRLAETVDYVHGFSKVAPQGVQDPQLKQIESVAEELEQIAHDATQSGEELPAGQVKDLAGRIRNFASYMDRGVTDKGDEKKSEAH